MSDTMVSVVSTSSSSVFIEPESYSYPPIEVETDRREFGFGPGITGRRGGSDEEAEVVGLDQGPSQPPSILDQMMRLTFPSSPSPSPPSTSYAKPSSRTAAKSTQSGQDGRDDHGTVPVVEIDLWADAGPGCGGVPWPAGQVLSDYLATRYLPGPSSSSSSPSPSVESDSDSPRRTRTLVGKSVLELGSGTGLVGLVAARLGASKVVITDQAQLLGAMRHNVALNKLEGLVDVLELNWGEPLPPLSFQRDQQSTGSTNAPDIILLADCVYFEPAFPLLVSTLVDLSDLCTKEGIVDPDILFCYKKRRKADKRFFTLLKKHFNWLHVDDDPRQEVYARDAISLFRLSRNRSGKS